MISAVAASSTIRARSAYLTTMADMERQQSPALRSRRHQPRVRSPIEEPVGTLCWSEDTDEMLIATARDCADAGGSVHWGDIARAVSARSGVVCTAKECKERYRAVAPRTLLEEARKRPTWFRRFRRRSCPAPAAPALAVVQVAEPCSPHSPPEGTRTFPATRGVPS